MAAELPLVSIITPSFNQARFLPATLQSVASQTYRNIEHLVMDGGSTDGSVAILEEWSREHPIIWRSRPDRGQAHAIAMGLDCARGEIVTWLNSDDIYLDRGVVADVVRSFGTGVEVLTGAGWFIDEAEQRMKRIPVEPRRLTQRALQYVDSVLQPATFVRRGLLLQFPIDQSLHYAFDWDLFIRLSAVARFVTLDRDIAGYRLHGTGKTVSGGTRRQEELLRVIERYHGRRSRAYAQLLPVVALHHGAARLPFGLDRIGNAALDRFARVTQRLFPTSGIPS